MQVSPVRNTSIEFGMSLKINPNLKKSLKGQSLDYIQNLQKVGEDIKDVKYFDVILDGGLYPSVKKAGDAKSKDYFAELKRQEPELGKLCTYAFDDGSGVETLQYFNPKYPKIFGDIYKKQALEKYESFKKLDIISQAAELSKMLEKQELQKIAEERQKDILKQAKIQEDKQLNTKKESLIDNLCKKFKDIF